MRRLAVSLATVAAAVVLLLSPSAVVAQTTPASLARAGWAAIRAGRHAQAAQAFSDALRLTSRDPSLHFGAGLAAYLLGDPGRAKQELDETLRLAPEYTDASLLLGELLYRGNDLDGAIRVYDAALALAPGQPTLTARAARWREEAALHRDFYQSQGAHFTVLFEGPSDEPLAAKAVELLEDAYWRIGAALSIYPGHIITVVLYTEQQFHDITRSPEWAAGAFDGRIKVPVRGALRQTKELTRVLSHEFTHALVRTIAPSGVPTWLDEGLAIAFEADGATWSASQLAPGGARVEAGRLASGFAGLTGDQARVAYAQSGVAVQTLIERQGTPALVALLQDIARGEPFAQAFEYRMLMPYGEFLPVLGGGETGPAQ